MVQRLNHRSETHSEVDPGDPVVAAFRRMRHMEKVSNLHIRAKELKQVSAAMRAGMDAEAEFQKAEPTTWRGILLKGKRAVFYLAANQDYEAIDMVKEFFARRTTQIDGEWLAGLRVLIDRVERAAEEPEKGVQCLKSILQGKSRPQRAS
jgi:hypothetical protein